MVLCRCPNDAMVIPQAAEVLDGIEAVRFFWRCSCMELFAFVGEPGHLAAGFAQDGHRGWRVFRAVGTASEVQSAVVTVSQVQPNFEMWSQWETRRFGQLASWGQAP